MKEERVILLHIRWEALRRRDKVRVRKESRLSQRREKVRKVLRLNRINHRFQGRVATVEVRCLRKELKESIQRKVNLEIKAILLSHLFTKMAWLLLQLLTTNSAYLPLTINQIVVKKYGSEKTE